MYTNYLDVPYTRDLQSLSYYLQKSPKHVSGLKKRSQHPGTGETFQY